MRKLQGAFGCGDDQDLILWDMLCDDSIILEQLAALVVQAFERKPGLFRGPDPGDQADEDAEQGLKAKEYREERANKQASIAAYEAERRRVFESGLEEERRTWLEREAKQREQIAFVLDGLLNRDVQWARR